MTNTTEHDSKYRDLDAMSVSEILSSINREDETVAAAVRAALPQIEALTVAVVEALQGGGRLFYIGAGTSGRLGILDAAECPPTFGVSDDLVNGLIAGGDAAIRKAVEFAEDDPHQAWVDLTNAGISTGDILIGIAASGRTPYVLGGLQAATKNEIRTGCVVCNRDSPVAAVADLPVEILVGPEFVTGSTRMKSGTATKMALNMLSTAAMIRLGRVKGNKMVDMQLTNNKLFERGVRIICDQAGVDTERAAFFLGKYGNVRDALRHIQETNSDPS